MAGPLKARPIKRRPIESGPGPSLTMAPMTSTPAIPAAQLRLSVAPMMDWTDSFNFQ